jgi:hypothetical protein
VDWVLVHAGNSGRLLLPWSWLLQSDSDQYQFDVKWSAKLSPDKLGVVPGTWWKVASPRSISAIGLALHDDRLYHAINNPKAMYFYQHNGTLVLKALAETVPENYTFAAPTLIGHAFWFSEPRENQCLTQTDVPLDSELFEYWY